MEHKNNNSQSSASEERVVRSVTMSKSVFEKIENIALRRDRSVHYILLELIEKNVDNPAHAAEPSSVV